MYNIHRQNNSRFTFGDSTRGLKMNIQRCGFLCVGGACIGLMHVALALILLQGCSSGDARQVAVDLRSDFQKGLAFRDDPIDRGLPISKAMDVETFLGVSNYWNGVYYFPYRGEAYHRALSLFSKAHPEFTSICGHGDSEGHEPTIRGSVSYDTNVSRHRGYTVVCRPLPPPRDK